MEPDDTHFEPAIVRAATLGAWIGGVSVVVLFLATIVLTRADMALMGVAVLAAFFGGSAFGAMLGASAAASRDRIPLPVPADTPEAELSVVNRGANHAVHWH